MIKRNIPNCLYACIPLSEFPDRALIRRPGLFEQAIQVATLPGYQIADNTYMIPLSFFKEDEEIGKIYQCYSFEEAMEIENAYEAVHAYNGLYFIPIKMTKKGFVDKINALWEEESKLKNRLDEILKERERIAAQYAATHLTETGLNPGQEVTVKDPFSGKETRAFFAGTKASTIHPDGNLMLQYHRLKKDGTPSKLIAHNLTTTFKITEKMTIETKNLQLVQSPMADGVAVIRIALDNLVPEKDVKPSTMESARRILGELEKQNETYKGLKGSYTLNVTEDDIDAISEVIDAFEKKPWEEFDRAARGLHRTRIEQGLDYYGKDPFTAALLALRHHLALCIASKKADAEPYDLKNESVKKADIEHYKFMEHLKKA